MKLKMKRSVMLFAVMAAALVLTAACGGGASADAGKAFENKYFKAGIVEGWTVFEDPKLPVMRIYPEKDQGMYAPSINLKFEGPISGHFEWAGTPEQAVGNMAKNYKGSEPQKEVINGLDFYKTSYTYGGYAQTMYIAKKDGNKITVTLAGTDVDKNPDVLKIMKTLTFK